MADFVDSEAEESGDEFNKEPTRTKDSSEEEDEEDPAVIQEELKDLINDEEIEEEGESDGSDDDDNVVKKEKSVSGSESDGEVKKKRRHSDIDDRLEDEDYDLLEENLGIKIKRTKYHRVRKLLDEDEDEDENDESQGRQEIERQLFDGGADEPSDDEPVVAEPLAITSEISESEESDVNDFIVDDDGHPISKGRKKGKTNRHTDSAIAEAQDIFGADFNFDDFQQQFDEDEDEDDYDEDDEDEEIGVDLTEEERPATRRSKKLKKLRKHRTIFDVYEPIELEKGHLTDFDNEVRTKDMPERFQLRTVDVPIAEDSELVDESLWIYNQEFSKFPLSIQDLSYSSEPTTFDSDPNPRTVFKRKGPDTVQKIKSALSFMRNQHLEAPFIAFYRKECVEPELDICDLWKLWAADEKWMRFKKHKEKLKTLFRNMKSYQEDDVCTNPDKPLSDNHRTLEDQDIIRVSVSQTTEDLQDCYKQFLLFYSKHIPNMIQFLKNKELQSNDDTDPNKPPTTTPSNDLKQASRRDMYTLCVNAGLAGFAKQFGLTPAQFGENVRDNYQRHEVNQCQIEPNVLALDYISVQFPTSEAVLQGVRYMVGMQIACDPNVRQCIRQTFHERALISIKPTLKGKKTIDENHPCFPMKYVKGKPVTQLKGEQFLYINRAEDERLLTTSIDIDVDITYGHSYIEDVKQLYHRDEFSHLVQEWNTQRSLAIDYALKKLLYPQIAKEIHRKLLSESKDCVIRKCCRMLHNWLRVAPYQIDEELDRDDDYNEDQANGIRILGISSSSDFNEPLYCAMINGKGEATDFLRLSHFLRRIDAFKERDRELKLEDVEKLKQFLLNKRPHVIVLTAADLSVLNIQRDIKSIIDQLENDGQLPKIPIELMGDDVSNVYKDSKKAETDFRQYPPKLREAISVARRLQDPLLELSQLCSNDEDLLCIKYHPLQDCVTKADTPEREKLLRFMYIEFINRVNEVGVDISKLIDVPYTQHILQFVCGLGPRKAAWVIKMLKSGNSGRLENRTQLVTVCKMGPKVFVNCAGFVKIDTSSLGDSTDIHIEVLDGSRVHPETYEWARKMAVDALEYDETSEDANPSQALEDILDSPDRLRDLDLDAFAEELERQGYGNKGITLYDIRAELTQRYHDMREPYRPLGPEDRFYSLTRETPLTLCVGKLVTCVVVGIARRRPTPDQLDQATPVRIELTSQWQCPFCLQSDFSELSDVWSHFDSKFCPGQAVGVRGRLDNNLPGFIATRNISDKDITNPEERVKVGMTIHCRVLKIDYERIQCELTSKSSDLSDTKEQFTGMKDIYYDKEAEDEDQTEEKKKQSQHRAAYIKRVIVHPSFRNITYKEAEKLMETMDRGEVIIRPSSKGSDHLTVTWKVEEGVLQHIDVKEDNKENAFSLGSSLWIGGEEFEDLDEIIARYIQPMASYVRDISQFKNYIAADGGKREILEERVRADKCRTPSKIPYYISMAKEYPGKALLAYLPRKSMKYEYITVTVDGYRFRTHTFAGLNSLLKWFKDHFRDPVPGGVGGGGSVRGRITPGSTLINTPGSVIAGHDVGPDYTPGLQRTPYAAVNTPMYGASVSQQPQLILTAYRQPFNHFQPMGTPAMMTPAMQTPSSFAVYQTSQYQQQQQQQQQTPGRRWQQQPQQQQPPVPTSSGHTPSTQNTTKTYEDWGKAAEQWAKRKDGSGRTSKSGRTPRDDGYTSRSEGMGTPRTDRTPVDATPLIDEH